MICRDKLFLVASNVDDSIKSQSSVYDMTLFSSFTDFEKYVNDTPVILDTLVITSNELQFTATNMVRLMNLLNSPFITINGSVIYLVDYTYDIKVVDEFLNTKGLTNWAVYQGDLSFRFISEIVSGTGRESAEGQSEVITYRIRKNEYVKQQSQNKYTTDENKYLTDEDLLAGIPDIDEAEDINPAEDTSTSINYVVGGDYIERPLLVFLLSQYLSLGGKTLIVEKDTEYHTLTELVTKSGIEYELIRIDEVLDDIKEVLWRIKTTEKRLIVIGCVSKRSYDYNFILDLLISNTKGFVQNVVRECNYSETPYGMYYTIVVPNTIPEVLKCCNSLKYDVDPELTTFIGLQSSKYGPVNISSLEMNSIIKTVLNKNKATVQILKSEGILLKGEDVVYDILSILNRANRR